MESQKKSGVRWGAIAAGICAAIVLAFVFLRLFYGVELSDEIFYIAPSYRLLQGNIPFVDAWDVIIGNGLTVYPVFAFFHLFTAGTQGIFLYSRITFFVFMLVLGLLCYLCLRRHVPSATLALLAIVAYAPFSLYNWSYNNLSMVLLFTGICFIFNGMMNQNKRRADVMFFIAGCCHAGMALSQISLVFACLILPVCFFLLILLQDKDWKKALRAVLFYALGGACAAVIVAAILMVVTHGALLQSIPNILTNPYYGAEKTTTFLQDTVIFFQQWWRFIARRRMHIGLSALVLIASSLARKRWPLVMLAQPLVLLLAFPWSGGKASLITIEYMFSLGMLFPIVMLQIRRYAKPVRSLLWLLFFGGLIEFFCISFSSAGGVNQGRYTFLPWAIGLVIAMLVDFADLPKARCKHFISILSVACMCGSLLFLWYANSYRERPVQNLTARMETGVYKNVYTTPARKQSVTELEETLKSLQQPGKRVFIYNLAPYAYLMLNEMVPATPTVWRINHEAGNTDWAMDYFEVSADHLPDQIYFLDASGYEMFLNQPEDDRLVTFLREEYEEVYVNETQSSFTHLYQRR